MWGIIWLGRGAGEVFLYGFTLSLILLEEVSLQGTHFGYTLLGETWTSVIMIEVVGELIRANKKTRYF